MHTCHTCRHSVRGRTRSLHRQSMCRARCSSPRQCSTQHTAAQLGRGRSQRRTRTRPSSSRRRGRGTSRPRCRPPGSHARSNPTRTRRSRRRRSARRSRRCQRCCRCPCHCTASASMPGLRASPQPSQRRSAPASPTGRHWATGHPPAGQRFRRRSAAAAAARSRLVPDVLGAAMPWPPAGRPGRVGPDPGPSPPSVPPGVCSVQCVQPPPCWLALSQGASLSRLAAPCALGVPPRPAAHYMYMYGIRV